ncbi:MAG: glutamate-5-semialdehyde dehydrogenase [Actinobacteria bacterium]|nr:glutamate-5-semialdehyde dehydrogenase [Actinomycetota bacterium]
MTTLSTTAIRDRLVLARTAGRELAQMRGGDRARILMAIADALDRHRHEVIDENAQDVSDARASGVETSLVDRLMLDERRIADMVGAVRAIAALPDPIGEVEHGWRRPNGLQILRERVPLGVVAVIYEGRPNVTTDAAALCLKSGNAVVLRGSRLARRSNRVLGEVIGGALLAAEAPAALVTMLGTDREEMLELVRMPDLVDLVIPRGGTELKATLLAHATVPVIFAAAGNNHVYVDADADVEVARRITLNAKVQRPGVCNAAETLLVHRAAAAEALPALVESLRSAGVELRVCAESKDILGEAGESLALATDDDYATEFLSLIMAVRVVASVEEAIAHVNRFGTGHSEAIVTRSLEASRAFQRGVDAACVFVNASTRFMDGGEFGMGAEIGISTQKLHARGPVGPIQLTTIKYLVTGEGQVR